MLAEYFVHDMENTQDWRLKGHAVKSFWRWIASWGAVVRTPADLGHDASAYALPPLRMNEVVIPVDHKAAHSAGMLFATNVVTLEDQRNTRRATLTARVEASSRIAAADGPCVIWCELNDESEALTSAIPGSVEVRGSDDVDDKADKLLAFARGDIRVLVTKPSIAGFGLNWQHCSRMVFVGASHSYEQTYQAIRRCWRFGQKSAVDVYVIRAETEQLIVDNYRHKEAEAARLGAEMAAQVLDSVRAEVQGATAREWNAHNPQVQQLIPAWLTETA
jgi:superfamily II DNA or RNA helicase